VAVEVPILLSFFVGTDPTDLWPNIPTQTGPTQGEVSVYDDQLVSRLYFFLAGFAFVIVLIGFVAAGFGSFVGERLREQDEDR